MKEISELEEISRKTREKRAELAWSKSWWRTFERIGAGLAVIAMVGLAAYGLNTLLPIIWSKNSAWLNSRTAIALCCGAVISTGLVFYNLREKHRFIYASAEMGASLVTAYSALSQLNASHDLERFLLTLLGAIYIFVRACDNFKKWREVGTAQQKIMRKKIAELQSEYDTLGAKFDALMRADPRYKDAIAKMDAITAQHKGKG
ncbi:hypothetical protein [Hymenobacter sp. GOD-10R]|uniref:hypothetical protein n=1 Tax=Hymenobacter sp. GOD-10R TaxID=3093922 RepID=UPI002D77972C|nr:hypothetical protein [Hymenobacter sp. GOD-10R]WRQ29144.1 hypothetical protein SD425_02560 [Hymenobacter sp. GOD-10R]